MNVELVLWNKWDRGFCWNLFGFWILLKDRVSNVDVNQLILMSFVSSSFDKGLLFCALQG